MNAMAEYASSNGRQDERETATIEGFLDLYRYAHEERDGAALHDAFEIGRALSSDDLDKAIAAIIADPTSYDWPDQD